MKTINISKEFAATIKEQGSIERDGIIYQYVAANEYRGDGFQWLDANHLNMMTIFDDRYSGICKVED